ncbi:hypothetical protein CVS40_10192 [Lucilia cuprina]|nr:hypothetical protein CVS40_10192 [Lucilia cuprina]
MTKRSQNRSLLLSKEVMTYILFHSIFSCMLNKTDKNGNGSNDIYKGICTSSTSVKKKHYRSQHHHHQLTATSSIVYGF